MTKNALWVCEHRAPRMYVPVPVNRRTGTQTHTQTHTLTDTQIWNNGNYMNNGNYEMLVPTSRQSFCARSYWVRSFETELPQLTIDTVLVFSYHRKYGLRVDAYGEYDVTYKTCTGTGIYSVPVLVQYSVRGPTGTNTRSMASCLLL